MTSLRFAGGSCRCLPSGKLGFSVQGRNQSAMSLLGFSFEFHGHDAFIDELYIEAAFRRRGYGRQAVAFVEKRAHEMGVNAIHLEVDRGNDPACELYRRAGYQDHDRFLMTKWLNGEAQ